MDGGGIGFKTQRRWIMVGFHDPDILHLEDTSPTPPLASVNISPMVLAGLQAGAKTSSAPSCRASRSCGGSAWRSQSKERQASIHDSSRLEKEVYGTVMGMAQWRRGIKEDL